MNECDIIMPVYNAYDAVKTCIRSVLKKTELGKKTKLILIDDKSSDERIVPMLEEFQEKNPRKIIVIKNESNLGFVQTVNIGMQYSKKDVLLLNSDTEVTQRWLEKIKTCAYSDKMIATVTPLSNYASLASVPNIFENNKIPEGYDLRRMGELVERYSLKLYPEIPSAHGFCMYIKRDALDEVGLFDEKTFGKGYGEENDFCFRCFKYGYRHVLCDDTYILHKGSESFGEKQYHNKELAIKYPDIWPKIDEWIKQRDNDIIGKNIALKINTEKDRPNILVIAKKEEDLFFDKSIDSIDRMRGKCNFHILTVENGYYELHSFFKEHDIVTGIFKKSMAVEPMKLYSSEYKRMLEIIMKEYAISLVYLANMEGQCFDVVELCKINGINLITNLNFYLINDNNIDENIWKEKVSELIDASKKIIIIDDYKNNKYKLEKKKTIKQASIGNGNEYDGLFSTYSIALKIDYMSIRSRMLEAYQYKGLLRIGDKERNDNQKNDNKKIIRRRIINSIKKCLK